MGFAAEEEEEDGGRFCCFSYRLSRHLAGRDAEQQSWEGEMRGSGRDSSSGGIHTVRLSGERSEACWICAGIICGGAKDL